MSELPTPPQTLRALEERRGPGGNGPALGLGSEKTLPAVGIAHWRSKTRGVLGWGRMHLDPLGQEGWPEAAGGAQLPNGFLRLLGDWRSLPPHPPEAGAGRTVDSGAPLAAGLPWAAGLCRGGTWDLEQGKARALHVPKGTGRVGWLFVLTQRAARRQMQGLGLRGHPDPGRLGGWP